LIRYGTITEWVELPPPSARRRRNKDTRPICRVKDRTSTGEVKSNPHTMRGGTLEITDMCVRETECTRVMTMASLRRTEMDNIFVSEVLERETTDTKMKPQSILVRRTMAMIGGGTERAQTSEGISTRTTVEQTR
jgi:hypothetical protein